MSTNPFKDLRERLGISQYELARRIKISKHAILRLEQGMYDNPLPTVIDYWLNWDPRITKSYLLNGYEEFQIATRVSNDHFLGDFKFNDCPVGMHPLVYLRTGENGKTTRNFNVTEVAKRLCISQPIVYYFEKRAVSQQSVPSQLLAALKECGYSDDELASLENAYAIYRRHLTTQQRVTSSNASKITSPVGNQEPASA